MSERIAIVGIACRYPDASDPAELWTNVLAGRRAFRRIPDERMRLADYWSADPAAPDRFYAQKAAVIEGFEFDRVGFRIAGSTYRTTDMTHWLALDTAARALADAGFAGGEGLPRRSTGVLVGNSLTGEFTRANLMRLRWPYVRRVVAAQLREAGWDDEALGGFLASLEARYKSPFPPVDEDTLAGGLSNTIAGRICNEFDFKGGGFTVDGACSSSLLSVSLACTALSEGQIDAAVVGGVDLSIDPFEIIGFAKTGALATGEMRVYDRHSNGFWPGEGCGMLVLLREQDAAERGLRSYAAIAGWGYASDGKGGITRPDADGHRLAIERAYQRAGFDMGTVNYLEGHGTGTAVGDETELRAFSLSRQAARPDAPPAAISTVKGNFGHTKAAAGVAGLIKAAMAVHHQVIPPATGHSATHPVLSGPGAALRVPDRAELWPASQPVRAAVSAMGFGGINAHVVLESTSGTRRSSLDPRTTEMVGSRQDCELLLLDAGSIAELRERVAALTVLCSRLAFAELTDLAVTLQQELTGGRVRAAVVAASPDEAERRLTRLAALLEGDAQTVIDPGVGVFLSRAGRAPRIGYLFPGQGSGRRADGGALSRRFAPAGELYAGQAAAGQDLADTAAAQPRIATASVAGLRVLSLLGIEAAGAVGHSLGELTGLHWAGVMDEAALLQLAAVRGDVMARASDGGGAMASVAAGPAETEPLLRGEPVVIAGYNGPRQTVLSGPAVAVERVCALATQKGLTTARIAVSHAFHSPLVAPAADGLSEYLTGQPLRPASRKVYSTVTGTVLTSGSDLRDLLVRQVVEPVRFEAALGELAAGADLLLEVGPGRVLSGLAADIAPDVPVVAVDTDSSSLAGLLSATGAAWVLGAPVRHDELFTGRFAKPLPLDKQFRFFVSPCELAPADSITLAESPAAVPAPDTPLALAASGTDGPAPSLDILRRLAAERAELPLEAVRPDSLPLDELHFSSITVGQIVSQAARELGIAVPPAALSLATATLSELAQALDDLVGTAQPEDADRQQPDGVAPWVRPFVTDLAEQTSPIRAAAEADGSWQVFAPPGHPLAKPLVKALEAARLGDGVLLCLPADTSGEQAGLMLAAAHAAVAAPAPVRFVTVAGRRGAAGLAKTLHLELPEVATTVITRELPARPRVPAVAAAVRDVVADVAATTGFSEVWYDEQGTRRVPQLRPVTLAGGPDAGLVLGPGDVLLVTGGGKGITAECALDLATGTGAAVGLLGRSDPAADKDLAANLGRFDAAGVTYRYLRADVTAADQVAAAVATLTEELGPVTAVLHGAGRNEPAPLARLTETAFRQTLAPKLTGLESVLAAVRPEALRLLITFGSIIGRAGLRGQADYATANDWMTEETHRFAAANPGCRCLALEWSVWSGAGMGERLGVLESLTRDGISPIPVAEGIATLRRILASPDLPTAMVIMGRAGGLPTITLAPAQLPLARFIDRARVFYPGIELVADAELSADTDLYLADHELDGDLLFPAVLGMEAMTQAAAAVITPAASRPAGPPVLEQLEFHRPIVVPPGGTTTIRIAALNRGSAVDVVIRSSDTSFQADHFRATLRWDAGRPHDDGPPEQSGDGSAGLPPVVLDPARDLYGSVLFQGKRFQRVLSYRQLAAKSCTVDISAQPADPWFSTFFPGELLLGDPGSRDAYMHGIQCCVPNATLLPQGVDRIYPAPPGHGAAQVVLHAAERSRDGDSYTYDLDVRDPQGRLLERWEGLRLRAVRKQDGSGPWVPALLGPYLERELEQVLAVAPQCVVEPGGDGSWDQAALREQTALAVSRLAGRPTTVRYRADGKPEVSAELDIAVTHAAGLTLAVASHGLTGCDAELAGERPAADWQALLGPEHFALAELIGREREEDLSLAATRVWGAVESLHKAGQPVTAPVTLASAGPGGWVALQSGRARIATFSTQLRDEPIPAVFTILTEGGS